MNRTVTYIPPPNRVPEIPIRWVHFGASRYGPDLTVRYYNGVPLWMNKNEAPNAGIGSTSFLQPCVHTFLSA